MEESKLLRVNYQKLSGGNLVAGTHENKPLFLQCNEMQRKELEELSPFLQCGNVLNLLNVKKTGENTCQAEFIIYEPDYLLDISSLSECFRPYGRHPLNYTLSRLQSKTMTPPLLLGNTANFFIDEFVNADESNPVDYKTALKKLFQMYAFEFTTCEDFRNLKTEQDFFANCQKHFKHIGYAVSHFFPKAGIDRKKVVLEPSFISNALGLQGRLDIMLCDYSAFIELKSGKAVEDFRMGNQFIKSAENHYIQMTLYLAVLEFNLNLKADDVRSYLLYSKYPVLSRESHSRKSLQAALSLRNQIVAQEYAIQKANDSRVGEALLKKINSENLNTEQLSGDFYTIYLAPAIDRFQKTFSQLQEYEKKYFIRLYTFILKELWISKAGEREYEGVKKAAVLWNVSFEDKLTAGEIMYDLRITDNQAATEAHTIRLEIPEYRNLYMPNFRPGDAVVLYERNSTSDTVNNRQVFRGAIESLYGNQLIIRIRYCQKNPFVWNEKSFYAIEHDYMDSVYTGMFRALVAFINANPDRRDLLLSKRINKDIFLLIGPPGSGKTSIALKKMVKENIQKSQANILLLAYTNRAVDEICKTLTDLHEPLSFIRIGSELNCAPEYRIYLLEKQLQHCTNRRELAGIIGRCRIFVGTVASVWGKPELFQLKRFDLAVIDEATQLLESHLLGIFCAKTSSGENAIGRFVLIGDHKQLPAVVLQSKDESKVTDPLLNEIGLTDLSNSLFERFYRKYRQEGYTDLFDMLSKQGRMHPSISAFPSEYFYDGLLESVGLPHQIEEWPDRRRLNFYPIEPSEKEYSDKANINEANQVVAICKQLYQEVVNNNETFDPQSIGIITSYRNQIALIRKQLQETGITGFSDILVDTVERFQGSQRDVIIYSFCVKTDRQLAALPNPTEENGKLIDRKLNVMLTRARKQLHIIGNEPLLIKNPLYAQLIKYITQLSF
ncbi:MAG: AAA family ATPase [Dysgonamonadaceae bacterium]|jgi:superfamily I DNA and/or RNA helicase|nr:AAA family ATPase [Dysgonamonadaceae bacterium]